MTFDTTRRDRVGCYGAGPNRTPTIDGLADSGWIVEDAIASAPVTLPSHATLLTGLYPPRHGARDNGLYALDPEVPTLPETLQRAGYSTAAFVGAFVLDARFGLDRGFDVYDFHPTSEGVNPRMPDFNERDAKAVTDAALAWLAGRDDDEAPFFLWVHYFDPHLPYRAPDALALRVGGDPYAAEIAWADLQLGRLLGALRDRGSLDRTLVVATADHGESLGEHGEATHGLFVYDATIRVPLVFAAPAAFAGGGVVRDRVVGLVDVRPTIEDLLGLDRALPCDGRSLLAPADSTHAIYSETLAPLHQSGWSPIASLRSATSKYVEAPRPEFYDLTSDPGETRDLLTGGIGPVVASDFRDEIAAIRGDVEPGAAHSLDAETADRLAALGYVRTAMLDDAETTDALADPKDMIALFGDSSRAEQLSQQGRWSEAVALARDVVSDCPTCSRSVRVLAFGLRRLGRPDEGIEVLRQATESRNDIFLLRSLAQLLILEGRWDAACRALDRYERAAPHDGRVPMLRGDIRARQGDLDGAVERWEEAIDLDAGRVGPLAEQRIADAAESRDADITSRGDRHP
ncbi:MAG: tetratricopeptide repeat protein [Gemmatimonadetes bacterium]|nr:tetratricopeptide repeat protein [Gemmatimonadota bacterium]